MENGAFRHKRTIPVLIREIYQFSKPWPDEKYCRINNLKRMVLKNTLHVKITAFPNLQFAIWGRSLVIFENAFWKSRWASFPRKKIIFYSVIQAWLLLITTLRCKRLFSYRDFVIMHWLLIIPHCSVHSIFSIHQAVPRLCRFKSKIYSHIEY